MTCDECAENYELGRSDQQLETSKYKNMLQICANIIGSNEDDLGNDLIKLNEDAKKWNTFQERMDNLGMTEDVKISIEKAWVDEFKQVNKDREIVKRLEEYISNLEANCGVTSPDEKTQKKINVLNQQYNELQKILEGKE